MWPNDTSRLLFRMLRRNDKGDRGMTIIELLIVVMILGLLSALALPSILIFANRARESEARSYVSSINKGQQAYYLMYGDFGAIDDLEIGIETATTNYTYNSIRNNAGGNLTADTTATPLGSMRGFAGRVWLGSTSAGVTSFSILCEGSSGTVPVFISNTCP